MRSKLILLCLTIALALPACKKLQSFLPKRKAAAKAESAQAATPAPVAVSTPTPAPALAINKNSSVIVFCYHRFEENIHSGMSMPPADFEKQMQEIKDAGFTVIPMKDFLAWRRGEINIPPKCAIITIDDGYVSGYDTAWPILKKFGYPVTMFVYLKYVNSGGKSVSWDQLAEMRDGGAEIGCHTVSHADLRKKKAGMTEEQYTQWLRDEIIGSKQTIEQQLGIKVSVFAYPFGTYNEKVREIVKEAGYEAAFTAYGQRLGWGGNWDELGRYAIESNQPKNFQAALNMIGGGQMPSSYTAVPAVEQMSESGFETEPKQGETISDPKPTLKANLSSMGEIDPASIEMRVSGFGVVPAKFDPATKIASYAFTQKLRDKNYTVILKATAQGKKVETRWSFQFEPSAAAPSPSAPSAASPKPAKN